MVRLIIGCLLIADLALLGCATTNPATSLNRLSNDEIEAYNNDPNNTDKIVCKYETPIGSRIEKKVCRKESVSNDRTRRDQQAFEEGLQRGRIITPR